jgi:hypothetical protein
MYVYWPLVIDIRYMYDTDLNVHRNVCLRSFVLSLSLAKNILTTKHLNSSIIPLISA